MSPPPIAVEHLRFRYAGAERSVLNDISFNVAEGETVLLLGPSGCGKSTLVLCLNGLIPHEIDGEMAGEVRIWGRSTRELQIGELCRQVGEVFQDPETQMVMPRLDEEIAFGLENLAMAPEQMPERITQALAQAGLQDRPRAWVDDLSGGQKQRLALAAALAVQPRILVLDEPTANLDPLATVSFFEALARLKSALGITIVLIEHRLDTVMPIVDRVVALSREGAVLAQGAPAEVFVAHGAALEAEGIWRPAACRLMQALATAGLAVSGCPLTLDEAEAALCAAGAGQHVLPAATPDTRQQARPTESDVDAPAVEIHHLSFAYGAGAAALSDVTLRIASGSFFALVGANGSGKTTLAKHLVGLLRPTQGTVAILGKDAHRQSRGDLARQVGYVFQNPEHQFVAERVADELAYSLRGRFLDSEIERRVAGLLRTFGLEGFEGANPFALSQGQKRRLSVATMVALDQPILVLDEPAFGQDQQSTLALMSTLSALNDAGTTVIFITHDMQLAAEYADEVAVMSEGRLIYQGSPRRLFEQAELMQQASLVLPPLAELARRLGLPPLLTVREWVQWLRPAPVSS